MEYSNISWTDHTWNPWVGCQHVSPECDHCYADFLVSKRMGKDFTRPWRTKTWREPFKWNAKAPEMEKNLAFLILTKRPSLIEQRLPADWGSGYPNVWLGTTCGVRSSSSRVDVLRTIPARVRFISAEPLLESLADINLSGIHWLIAGGESGSKFRPMNIQWARELRDRCGADNVGFFFKQESAFRPAINPVLDGKQYHEPPLEVKL
jgi:protein gp37